VKLKLSSLLFLDHPVYHCTVLLCALARDVKCPDAQEILYTIKERQYFEHIEKAYNYASQLLLDLLMNEKHLMDRLMFIFIYVSL